MKKLFFIFLLLFCSSFAIADDVQKSDTVKSATVKPEVVKSATVKTDVYSRILDELIEIRSIQDSTYRQRMRAYELRDSIKAVNSPSEYAVLSGIKSNTDKNKYDGWNVYGWFAIIIAFFSLFVSAITFMAQSSTERHTQNAPISAQKGKLEDLPRHLYRNLVCTAALIFVFKQEKNIIPRGIKKKRKSYPSESHFLKLQTLPDDVFLPVDVDEKSYSKIHEQKLLFRNYNTEVLVACEHISRPDISDESLRQDFDNLLFKPLYLTRRSLETICLFGSNRRQRNNGAADTTVKAANTIVKEHFDKLLNSGNFITLLDRKDILEQCLPKQNGEAECLESFNKIDETGAICRSLGDDFIKFNIEKNDFLKQENEKSSAGKCKKKDKTKEADNADKKKNEKKPTIKDLFEIENEVQFNDLFIRLCGEKYKDKEGEIKALFEVLKPYLNYLKEKEWKFPQLLGYILAIDASIETSRIGMINY